MNIVMVGTGYVGLISGLGFAEFGFNVTCIDKDNDRLRKLLDLRTTSEKDLISAAVISRRSRDFDYGHGASCEYCSLATAKRP